MSDRGLLGADTLAMSIRCDPQQQSAGIDRACERMATLLADAPALTARADYGWVADPQSFRTAGEALWQSRVLQLLDGVAENREKAPLPRGDLHDLVVRQMFTSVINDGMLPKFSFSEPLHVIAIPSVYNNWSDRLMRVFGDWCAQRIAPDRLRSWQALRTFRDGHKPAPCRQAGLMTLITSVVAAIREPRGALLQVVGEQPIVGDACSSAGGRHKGDGEGSVMDHELSDLRMQFVLAQGVAHRLSVQPRSATFEAPSTISSLQAETQVDRWTVEVLMAAVLSGVQTIRSWDANVFEEVLLPPTLYFCLAQIWVDLIEAIVTRTTRIDCSTRRAAAPQIVRTARSDVERLRRCLGLMHEHMRAFAPNRKPFEEASNAVAGLIRNAQAFGQSLMATVAAMPASVWIDTDKRVAIAAAG